jgi:hypothetical protein
MSDTSDDMESGAACLEVYMEKLERPFRPLDFWKTRTGEEILVCEMTDSHLINAIKLIERQYPIECGLRAEARRRGFSCA